MPISTKLLLGIFIIILVIVGVSLVFKPSSSLLVGTSPPDPVVQLYHFSETVGEEPYEFYIFGTNTSTAEATLKSDLQQIINELN